MPLSALYGVVVPHDRRTLALNSSTWGTGLDCYLHDRRSRRDSAFAQGIFVGGGSSSFGVLITKSGMSPTLFLLNVVLERSSRWSTGIFGSDTYL
jgi:hypothetical protein